MKRQALTDPAGHWFDLDRATKIVEGSWHNGSNFISLATGSQWSHETLYRTASQRWVLNAWSAYQGTTETWEEIDDEFASRWLVANGREHPDAAALIADLEV